ncbi:MAG: hypothetical protein JRI23_35005, partial [Deltaproteobacteria bacterium]|nr:hypothetical protein [Deltaproteobacteria bacterium]MBW2537517.1 hypothetical protein [Deltaproteobacteria bacterium]
MIRLRFLPHRHLAAVVAASCSFGLSAHAEDLVVPPDPNEQDPVSGMLDVYENVTIAGTLPVTTHNDADSDRGWVYIRASSITIEAGGVIEASLKGYLGTVDGGTGYDGGEGQTPAATTPPHPGGGGAHAGAGGPGLTIAGCALFTDAAGGSAY